MWLNATLVLMTSLYPLAVFFGLQHWQPGSLGLLLAALVLLRLLLEKRPDAAASPAGGRLHSRWLLSALLIFAVGVFLVNDQQLLRFYPVLMNGLMLSMFGYSLFSPPPLAERLARLREPDLDAHGVRYTRAITQVWCGFFFLNGCVAAWTAVAASLAAWTLYNGLLAYLLMALVFAVEYGVRQRLRGRLSI